MSERVSVLLICEQPELAGSGCCRVPADNPLFDLSALFCEINDQRQRLGLLYRVLQRFYATALADGQLTIVCVDPKNQLYLLPKLWRDVWRHRPGWRAGCQSLLQAFALPAVIVNGRPLSRRGTIDPDELCHAIGTLLHHDCAHEESTHG